MIGLPLAVLLLPLSRQDTMQPLRVTTERGVNHFTVGVAALPELRWRVGAATAIEGLPDGFVMVTGLAGLPDGEVAVGDGPTPALRIFRGDGRELHSVGRAGEGPGEYRGIESVGVLPRDSVWIYDMRLARLTVFDRQRRVAATVALPPTDRGVFGEVIGVSRDTILGVALPALHVGMAEGVRRDSFELHAQDRRGGRSRRLAIIPGRQMQVRIRGDGGRLVVSKSTVPSGYGPVWVATGQGVAIGGTERYRLELLRFDGRVKARVTVIVAQRPAARGSPNRFAPEVADAAPVLEGGFLVRLDAETTDHRVWWVLHAADGRPLGRVRLPAAWRVRVLTSDRLLATMLGPDEEEIVVVASIRNTGPG